MLSMRLERLKTIAAETTLCRAEDEDQKKTADELLSTPMGHYEVTPDSACARHSIRYIARMATEPRANPLLLGHENAEATLIEALRAGRMHHAWLITGPEGVGKATLAYRFAQAAGRWEGDTWHWILHPVFRRARRLACRPVDRGARFADEKRALRTQIAVDDVDGSALHEPTQQRAAGVVVGRGGRNCPANDS